MDRTLRIEVDSSTWPAHPAQPTYPPTFPTTIISDTINISELLLVIGLLTTPAHATGVSLSEFWAWVRYFYAVSNDPDLRLTTEFSELDSHQKTILSDDFGMGAPIHWLLNRLDFGPICDGRYFIDRIAASVGASTIAKTKRGPSKSPDFVAKDTSGIWHVIECKGTQSGSGYLDRQLGVVGPPPSGAMAQKRTIIFPAGYSGQRLACGLAIGVEGGSEPSCLRIVDPPGIEEFVITSDQISLAEDSINRSAIAKSLRLSGFVATASAMSAPLGRQPSSHPTRGRAEEVRQQVVKEKEKNAADELSSDSKRELFSFDGEKYRGIQIELNLPFPLEVKGTEIRSVRIHQGVNERLVVEAARNPLIQELLSEVNSPWREAIGRTKTQSDDLTARLQVGTLFTSQIELRP